VHIVGDLGIADHWLVKSENVSIQARYAADEDLPERNTFVRAVAVGGSFLGGNTIVIGALEDQITWNGAPILENQTSSFDFTGESNDGAVGVRATRTLHSSLVQDPSTENPGVTFELPLNVSLIANRLRHHVNVLIKMKPQEGGQDGLCGNFNGLAADDALEFVSSRLGPMGPEESLF